MRLITARTPSLPSRGRLLNCPRLCALLAIIAALSAFIFSVTGIKGGWTGESLINQGIPWYLKTGLISYGVDGLLWIVWVLVDPLVLTEITQNQLSPLIVSSGVLNGLALVVAALLPWHKLREQV